MWALLKACKKVSVARCFATLLAACWAPGCIQTPAEVPHVATSALPNADAAAGESAAVSPDSPHLKALRRMNDKRWQRRDDRTGQLQVPLPDGKHWKRVRFSLIEHFVGFRYGKSPDALAVVLMQPVKPGEAVNSGSCMQSTEHDARAVLNAFDVHLADVTSRTIQWRHQAVKVRQASGAVDYGFGPRYFAVAWAAYPAYSDGCLVLGIAIPWDGERALAEQLRERWLTEGLSKMKPLTDRSPVRE